MRQQHALAALISALLATPSYAKLDDIESIEVNGHQEHPVTLTETDDLLRQQGVQFSQAGGLSSLPILNGMMGERISLLTDGMPTTSACGNQMNPPLSYTPITEISRASVSALVSPVSEGGDNIAGVINIRAINTHYNDEQRYHGSAEFGYRSNSNKQLYSINAGSSSEHWYLDYTGTQQQADSYEDGNGDLVLDTLYKAQNHALVVANKQGEREIAVRATYQHIPYQGFANQYMDMTDNTSYSLTAQYNDHFDFANLESTFSWRDTSHEMGFFTDEKTGMMPMNTEAQELGAKLKWTLARGNNEFVLGQEFFEHRLDDYWPAVEGSMMMGPNDYININNGVRRRSALYGQWQTNADSGWQYNAGMRVEKVMTDTDDVQAYNDMPSMMNLDADAADEFNSQAHRQEDWLVDATLSAERAIDDKQSIAFGVARKNRAPNLYERYTWGQSPMATSMIGWYGDGNGYIGDIDLAPETAHNVSATYRYQASSWHFSANAWHSAVDDYIDADVVGTFNRGDDLSTQRNILQFTNVDARLYGVTLDASKELGYSLGGQWQFANKLKWQRGERRHSDQNLYQILPFENMMQLTYERNHFQGALQWQYVGDKDRVDEQRLENETEHYSLLNISASYQWNNMSVTAAVSNLLDKQYDDPLAGVSIAEFKQDMSQGYQQLAGAGRSFNFNFKYTF